MGLCLEVNWSALPLELGLWACRKRIERMRLCAFEVLVLWLELVVEVDGPPPPIIASILSLVGTWLAGTLRTIGCVAYYCFCLLPSWRYTCSNGSIRLDVTVLVGVCARLGYVLRGDGL